MFHLKLYSEESDLGLLGFAPLVTSGGWTVEGKGGRKEELLGVSRYSDIELRQRVESIGKGLVRFICKPQ